MGLAFVLWLGYTALQTLSVTGHVFEGWNAVLGFVPRLLGVAALLSAGLSPTDCFLRMRWPSWQGLAVLAAVFVFALAAILPVSEWQGWSWLAALVLTPDRGKFCVSILRSGRRSRSNLPLQLGTAPDRSAARRASRTERGG